MRRSVQALWAAGAAACVLLASGSAVSAAADYRWRVIKPTGEEQTFADSAKAFSDRDLWVFTEDWSDYPSRPLAHHFDGARWKDVPLPAEVTGKVRLVDGSPSGLWALADAGQKPSSILHWDGARWTVVKTVGYSGAVWYGLRAFGPRDVRIFARGKTGTDILRYDGTRWSSRATSAAGIDLVSPLRDGTAWAARGASAASADSAVARWTGAKWTRTTPSRAVLGCKTACTTQVTGLLALSKTKVFASLAVTERKASSAKGVLVRWNGRKWTLVRRLGAESYGSLVPDGSGGFWAIHGVESNDAMVVHHTAKGGLVRFPYRVKYDWLLLGVLAAAPDGTVVTFGARDTDKYEDGEIFLGWRLDRTP
ncbi:hypothetical protein EDD29_6990 [Actinocorallia herbida]|uniref:Uncharacterized protein n=1 Tax=Actinocorallia herbida TaxID=58109 RepID=A0A3N1D6Z8_9ACTN|nr:hypothetical protein [Actinocorallia herbida]ROO89301.1 hypothetical protein EDD29_6990 [Actinocorallia herbida]